MIRNIGLTGNIACGKSKVAEIFENLGFYIIDSDISSRQVMKKGQDCYNKIISYFGDDILDNNGDIIRKKLGDIVFADRDKLKILESIVHPAIFDYEKKLRSEIYGKDNKAVVITHAALIIETGSYKLYDGIIVVTCNKEKQIKRLTERDNIDYKKAEEIIANQLEESEKVKYANFIIDNSSNLDDLHKEVERVYELICQINYGVRHG